MESILTKAAFSRLCGVSRPAIGDAIRRGVLVATPEGKLDVTQADNAAYLARQIGRASCRERV